MDKVIVKPKAQQSRAIERVNRLKAALVEVMANVPPTNFNSSMVPAAAGVNRTSMYRYYRTPDALAAEVFDDRIGELMDTLNEDATLVEALHRINDIFCDIPLSMLQTVEMVSSPIEGIDKLTIELHKRYPQCEFATMRRIVKTCIVIDAEAGILLLDHAK